MVYTVTCNPAIDHLIRLDELREGEVNRAAGETIRCGGKGINVSAVLRELGVESVALGFVAGASGEALERGVTAMGLASDFIRLEHGETRINTKLTVERETQINGIGPEVDAAAWERLLKKLEQLRDGDALVLSGSLPRGLAADAYGRMLERVSGRALWTVVDAGGALLEHALGQRPFLIKPNLEELGELYGRTLSGAEERGREEVARLARGLQERGARNVLVSMAGDGALLLDEHGEAYYRAAHRGEVISTVGAGDSMVAGVIASVLARRSESGAPADTPADAPDYEDALRLGTAAGAATAFSEGLAVRERILYYLTEAERRRD